MKGKNGQKQMAGKGSAGGTDMLRLGDGGEFTLNILGCGSATPSLRHLPSCQVIEYRGQLMMIDCGEGAQLSMRRMGLKFARLTHIFISHLHEYEQSTRVFRPEKGEAMTKVGNTILVSCPFAVIDESGVGFKVIAPFDLDPLLFVLALNAYLVKKNRNRRF